MEDKVRINKYIADAGICSRRAADRLIEDSRVLINGTVANNGMRVSDTDLVEIDGNAVSCENNKVYFAFNKPVGIVCTSEKKEKNNIIDFIGSDKRLLYAGRLDKDSEGLIIMTNDGDLINEMMRARNGHEKEYVVTVNKDINNDFVDLLKNGVYLDELDVTTRKCKAWIVDSRTFRIVLTQGLNRQIRRMCSALGVKVVSLKRDRIMNIMLGDLKPGKMRPFSKDELSELKNMLRR